MTRLRIVLAGLLLAACPKPPLPPPVTHAPSEEDVLAPLVKEDSRRAEALLKVQDEMIWAHWTTGAPLAIDKTYDQAKDLFTPKAIHEIDRLRALAKEPREIRALTSLHVHFVGEYLAAQLADVTDAVANLQASMTFTVDGKELAYRDLERLLANEKSVEKRRALYQAATPLVVRLNELLRRREDKTAQLLQEIGYPSYEAFGSELRQAELDGLAALAEEILQVTQSAYLEELKHLSQRELGLSVEKLQRADISRLFRPRGVDPLFPKELIYPRALATVKALGFDPATLPNLHIDAEARPRKNPRPLTVAVSVPGDVRVSLVPAGGVRDQGATLHELGDALHFARSKESRFELAKLGDAALGESFGSLFEDLLEDPLWLEEQVGLTGDKLSADLAASSAYKLFQVRRAAGRLLYAVQLHRRDAPDAKALFHAIFSRTYGVPFSAEDDERYLIELDDLYASADSLRAWFLAGQLQGQLKARFGPAWWHSKAAGEFLDFLWAKGNALTAPELARVAGEDGLKPDVLLLRLATNLKRPIVLSATPTARPDSNEPSRADAGEPSDAGTHESGPTASASVDAGILDAGTMRAPTPVPGG